MSHVRVAVCVVLAAMVCRTALGQNVAKPILEMPAEKLVALLGDENASTFDKAKACQRLAVVGDESAVPALAAQLPNEELNVYARTALEAIEGSAADEALREAAGKLSGRPLAGVLASLGKRGDEQSIGLLARQLAGEEAAIKAAAANALAMIGTADAADAILAAIKADPSSAAVGEAALVCAERLGDAPEAAELYGRLAESKMPEHLRLAAMLGQARANPSEAAAWLKKQLQSKDRDHFNAGLAASRELEGDAVAAALTELLPSLPPERRALALRALGDREQKPPVALLADQCDSESPEVRTAAVDVLAESGTKEAASKLIDVAFGEGEAAPLAQQWLKRVRSEIIDQAVAQRVAASPEDASKAIVELIGSRRIVALKPHLHRLIASSDGEVQQAAMAALAQVGDATDLDALVKLALGGGEVAAAAKEALRAMALRIDDREAGAARLAGELPKAAEADQAFLLQLLREMGAGSERALAAVVAAAKSDDSQLKEAATRELGSWPTAEASAALLELAKNDPQSKYQIRALRGYIRIGRQLQLTDDERLTYFKTAVEAARRDDERVLAFEILTRVDSAKSLETATAFLGEPALKAAAAKAALSIAGKLMASDPAAVAAAMKQVQDAGVSAEVSSQAGELKKRAEGSK